MKHAFFFFATIIFLSLNASAHSISIYGLGDVSKTNSTGFTTAPDTGYGGGIMLGSPIGGRVSFAAGLDWYSRAWKDTTTAANNLKAEVFTIPFIFKLHLGFLHIGLGGYVSSFSGTLNESGATTNSALPYSTYGISQTDEGFLGDVGLSLPIGGAAFIIDATYMNGVTNLATSTNNTFQVRDMIYRVGFAFPVAGSMPGVSIGSRSVRGN